MAEYIEREALEAHLNRRLKDLRSENGNYDHYTDGYEEAVCTVEEFPAADVVPVVRCKGCEKSGVTEFGKRYCKEPMGSFYGCIPVEGDYFCSGGRRKGGEP